jgi:hypothetical protein
MRGDKHGKGLFEDDYDYYGCYEDEEVDEDSCDDRCCLVSLHGFVDAGGVNVLQL